MPIPPMNCALEGVNLGASYLGVPYPNVHPLLIQQLITTSHDNINFLLELNPIERSGLHKLC